MNHLADFPATVYGVKTLADGGIRVTFDLPETESPMLTRLHELKRGDRYLRVVVYDNDEFQGELKNSR